VSSSQGGTNGVDSNNKDEVNNGKDGEDGEDGDQVASDAERSDSDDDEGENHSPDASGTGAKEKPKPKYRTCTAPVNQLLQNEFFNSDSKESLRMKVTFLDSMETCQQDVTITIEELCHELGQ
ncbi:hypothetical protein BG005_004204, partial [Podila minutissima]